MLRQLLLTKAIHVERIGLQLYGILVGAQVRIGLREHRNDRARLPRTHAPGGSGGKFEKFLLQDLARSHVRIQQILNLCITGAARLENPSGFELAFRRPTGLYRWQKILDRPHRRHVLLTLGRQLAIVGEFLGVGSHRRLDRGVGERLSSDNRTPAGPYRGRPWA